MPAYPQVIETFVVDEIQAYPHVTETSVADEMQPYPHVIETSVADEIQPYPHVIETSAADEVRSTRDMQYIELKGPQLDIYIHKFQATALKFS